MSDDYTPTTLVVRGHYAWKSESIAAAPSYIEGVEQFDRWLVEHESTVAARVCASLLEVAHDEGVMVSVGGQLFISQAVMVSAIQAAERGEVKP